MMITYDKVMTRDTPLIMVEAWYRCFAESVPRLCGFAWPMPIFVYQNGTVESYRPSKVFHEEVPARLSQWAKDPNHVQSLYASFERYFSYAKKLRQLKAEEKSENSIQLIQEVVTAFVDGGAGLIVGYWLVEWNNRALEQHREPLFSHELVEKATKLREGDTLMDDAIDLLYGYLDAIAFGNGYQKEYMKFLTYQELRDAVDFSRIRKRGNGYAYINGDVVLKIHVDGILSELGYQLNDPVPEKVNLLAGMKASEGRAQGKVSIVVNRDQLSKVQPGDVLIAPMTTPWYVPAMQKAAAIATDEGGILCHAAIVSRELGIPCVVGTKVATKVFKDGDLVEVDANNGVVRKLK